MNRKERRAARKPITNEDEKWLQLARETIAGYDGDTERLVMELLIAREVEAQQVSYLQGEIEKLGKMYPGLFTLAYHAPGAERPKGSFIPN